MPIATADALMGFGFPAQQAALMGGNPNALTCVGTAQTGAAVIKSKNTELVTAGGATAAVFPTTVGIMEPYFINNQAATTGLVYVPSGHSVNGSLNGSVSIPQAKAAIIWQYKKSNWCFVVLA